MHQVNNQLPFEIETPSDEELMARFRSEQDILSLATGYGPIPTASRNRRKRERKARRKAGSKNRAHA